MFGLDQAQKRDASRCRPGTTGPVAQGLETVVAGAIVVGDDLEGCRIVFEGIPQRLKQVADQVVAAAAAAGAAVVEVGNEDGNPR